MKSLKTLIFLSVLALAAQAGSSTDNLQNLTNINITADAHAHHKGCNMFPASRLRFPIRANARQMSRDQFKKILEAAESVYSPIFESKGLGRLHIIDSWFDDTPNAIACVGSPCNRRPGDFQIRTPNDRFIEIFGGIARNPYMSPEGLMLVVCHEIGHHLGGYPRYSENQDPLSTEGQADYFATAKCARLIYASLSPKTNQNWAWANKNNIPVEVQKSCLSSFPRGSLEAVICARSMLAGLSLAKVLSSLREQDPSLVTFGKKDPNVVATTFESHPEAQCRLDTYTAGAVCQADMRIPFSMTNPVQGACTNPMRQGARPRCWFRN